jgi:hypothetical protein
VKISRRLQPAADPQTPFFGLHLLRRTGQGRYAIVARAAVSPGMAGHPGDAPTDDLATARLNLAAKRPVVTLSIWQAQGGGDFSAEDFLQPADILPYLRSGASALVAPWWPTSPAADQLFWAAFYDLLAARRLSLGEAVWRARLVLHQALPASPDWLAYTLFGDPRARPYVPEASDGYTTLECLDLRPGERMVAGNAYRFQAAIHRRPPVWFDERLVEISELPEKARVRFIALGLGLPAAEPIELQPDANRTTLFASMEIPLSQPGQYTLMAQFFAGREHLSTLELELDVHPPPAGGSS